jgi:hypothetical protein
MSTSINYLETAQLPQQRESTRLNSLSSRLCPDLFLSGRNWRLTCNIIAPTNYERGLNRLFVVLAVCWYIGAVVLLWPKWDRAFSASCYAEHIETNSCNSEGTYTAIEDEIPTASEGKTSAQRSYDQPAALSGLDPADREAKALRPKTAAILCALLPIGVY